MMIISVTHDEGLGINCCFIEMYLQENVCDVFWGLESDGCGKEEFEWSRLR